MIGPQNYLGNLCMLYEKKRKLNMAIHVKIGNWFVSGTQNQSGKKWIEGKLNQTFLNFLPNFCHIWWFFKSFAATFDAIPLWKIIKYGKKIGKRWWKTLFNLHSTYFSSDLWLSIHFLGWFRVSKTPSLSNFHMYTLCNFLFKQNW